MNKHPIHGDPIEIYKRIYDHIRSARLGVTRTLLEYDMCSSPQDYINMIRVAIWYELCNLESAWWCEWRESMTKDEWDIAKEQSTSLESCPFHCDPEFDYDVVLLSARWDNVKNVDFDVWMETSLILNGTENIYYPPRVFEDIFEKNRKYKKENFVGGDIGRLFIGKPE